MPNVIANKLSDDDAGDIINAHNAPTIVEVRNIVRTSFDNYNSFPDELNDCIINCIINKPYRRIIKIIMPGKISRFEKLDL